MSQQDLSLRALANEATRQIEFYKGRPYSYELEIQMRQVAEAYCQQLKGRWGIEESPWLVWSEIKEAVSIGVKFDSPLDEAMIIELMDREGLENV